MNRTKIEWTDGTINPIKGRCRFGCDYCYARKMYRRFKWDPSIRLDLQVFEGLALMKPCRVFVCSTHEMYGDWIQKEWIGIILKMIEKFPQITFQILTKNPERATLFFYPKNVWLGTTINRQDELDRMEILKHTDARIKFISFEPLFEEINTDSDGHSLDGIDWIIIGSQTQPYRPPKKEWVDLLIEQAEAQGIPIFLKNNLKWRTWKRQEFPSV